MTLSPAIMFFTPCGDDDRTFTFRLRPKANQHHSHDQTGQEIECGTEGKCLQRVRVIAFDLPDLIGELGEANPAGERGELHQVEILSHNRLPGVSQPLRQQDVAKQSPRGETPGERRLPLPG